MGTKPVVKLLLAKTIVSRLIHSNDYGPIERVNWERIFQDECSTSFRRSVSRHGIKVPIGIETEYHKGWCIYNGHHRLAAGLHYGLRVPCVISDDYNAKLTWSDQYVDRDGDYDYEGWGDSY